MNDEEIYQSLLNQGINAKKNEPMKNHTSFRIGGPASIYAEIETIEQLQYVLKISSENKIKTTIIGNGSNVLVADEGFDGIVLKIAIKQFEIKKETQNNDEIYVIAGSGNAIGEIAQKLLSNSITGFEELSGVPGTIGGALRMNAGAHGKEIKDIVESARVIDYSGNMLELSKEDMKLEYRSSIFSREKYIICSVKLKLCKGNQKEIQNKMLEYSTWRKEHQPLKYPNAGSIFKRGEDFVTSKLIDEAGLKGYKIGGAQISEIHAGFIVNTGNATAKDVLDLIEYTKEQVYKKFNKKIETEVEIIK